MVNQYKRPTLLPYSTVSVTSCNSSQQKHCNNQDQIYQHCKFFQIILHCQSLSKCSFIRVSPIPSIEIQSLIKTTAFVVGSWCVCCCCPLPHSKQIMVFYKPLRHHYSTFNTIITDTKGNQNPHSKYFQMLMQLLQFPLTRRLTHFKGIGYNRTWELADILSILLHVSMQSFLVISK